MSAIHCSKCDAVIPSNLDRDRAEFTRRYKREPTEHELAVMDGAAPNDGDMVVTGRRRKMGLLACEACAKAAMPARPKREKLEDMQESFNGPEVWID